MIVVLVGPTGVGKTKTSVMLAKEINAEIISGDSVQVYKKLDIGSAKVTKEEQDGITHHLIDILEPFEEFSSSLFQKLVREKIADITSRGKNVIICGGTGYYIKASLYDYTFNKKRQDSVYASLSDEELFQKLLSLDKAQAEKLHQNNRIRVLRALENAEAGITSITNKNNNVALYDFHLIGLTMSRDKVYERINQRVDVMLEIGLLEEVKSLKNYEEHINAIGYNELFKYLNNEYNLEFAISEIKKNSRRYAKRQYTWFNNQMNTSWIDVENKNTKEVVLEILELLKG